MVSAVDLGVDAGQKLGELCNLAFGARHAAGDGVRRHQHDAEALVVRQVVVLDVLSGPFADAGADVVSVNADPGSQLVAVFIFQRVVAGDHGDARFGELVNSGLAEVLIRDAG